MNVIIIIIFIIIVITTSLVIIYLFITFLVCKAVFSGSVDKRQPCGNGAVP